MTRPPARPDAGFSVVEALVAMAVLSVGAVTLLTAVEAHAARTQGLGDRIVARWVAENVIAATALGLDAGHADWRAALSVDWTVRTATRPLPGTGLLALDVAVAPPEAGPAAVLVRLTGYVAQREGAR